MPKASGYHSLLNTAFVAAVISIVMFFVTGLSLFLLLACVAMAYIGLVGTVSSISKFLRR